MAALTGADLVKHKEEARLVSLPVAAATTIYQGGLLMVNASGYVEPATPTSGSFFAGIASADVDNSGGLDAALDVLCFQSGLHLMAPSGVAVTDVMSDAFAETDNVADTTIGAASTANAQKCGKIVNLEGDLAWVDIAVGINQQELGT